MTLPVYLLYIYCFISSGSGTKVVNGDVCNIVVSIVCAVLKNCTVHLLLVCYRSSLQTVSLLVIGLSGIQTQVNRAVARKPCDAAAVLLGLKSTFCL